MTLEQLEDAIDAVILASGLPAEKVADVLDMMLVRYEEEAASE